MRRMLCSLFPMCLLLSAAACPPKPEGKVTSGNAPAPADGDPAHPMSGAAKGIPALSATARPSHRLAGYDVRETRDGAWKVRRTASGGDEADFAEREGAPRGAASPRGGGASARKRLETGAAPPPPEADFAREDLAEAALALPSPSPSLAMSGDEALASGPASGALMRHLPPMAGPLKAGSTDDNAEFDAFLEFLATWSDRPDTAGQVQLLDVRDRRTLQVVDAAGRALPGVRVDVYDADTEKPLGSATTYGDGRAPFYPKLRDPKGEARRWLVNARLGERHVSATFARDAASLRLELPVATLAQEAIPLDVVFLIDTTGSMSDEIQRVKETLLSVTQKTRNAGARVDLRYAAVLYRDVGDEYVTRTHPFTSDIGSFDQALQSVGAGGGGDGPESLNQGLAEAMHGVEWREQAAKVVFLIADAPPHMDYADDVPYGESAMDAVAKGIRVHAVAASGLDPMGTLCFRQVAQFTRGRFIFIEYGSVAASAASHGVKGEVKSNNLDDIVYEQLVREIEEFAGTAG